MSTPEPPPPAEEYPVPTAGNEAPISPGQYAGEIGPAVSAERKRLITSLGDGLRLLGDAAVRTEAPDDALGEALRAVEAATATLSVALRNRSFPPDADDLQTGTRIYNPVSGRGNPVAPSMTTRFEGTTLIAECTLGWIYEGPPGYVHGGVSAWILDHLLGHANIATDTPGMTVELTVRYRRPVPIATPLVFRAQNTGRDGRKVHAVGTIATQADPDTVLVEATGLFLMLTRASSDRLFAGRVDTPG